MNESKSLPSIQSLFIDSWELFSSRLLNLFLFSLIGWLAFLALGLLTLFLLIVSGVGTGVIYSFIQPGGVNILQIVKFIPAISIIIILASIACAILGALIQIGIILILDDVTRQVDFKKIVRQSSKYIIPLFLTGLLAFLFLFGSFFVFVIPVVIIGLLFSFYPFEVILNGKSYLSALKGSVSIFKGRFWQIFFRLLLLWLLGVILTLSISRWLAVSLIVHTLAGWYSLCFIYTLYKQAKSAKEGEAANLKWISLVSLAGWIIAILAVFGFIKGASNLGGRLVPQAPQISSPSATPKEATQSSSKSKV